MVLYRRAVQRRRIAKDGNVNVVAEVVEDSTVNEATIGDTNVTGTLHPLELAPIAAIRQRIWDWSSTSLFAGMDAGITSCVRGLTKILPKLVGRILGHDYNTALCGVVVAALNGDLRADPLAPEVKEDGQTIPVPQPPGIVSLPKRRPRKGVHAKRRYRVPVLAGDVASELKLRHGFLVNNGDNRKLIRADATRKVEALRREGNEIWKSMRSHDAYLVVMHASEMFWLQTADEAAVSEMYSFKPLAALRGARAKCARAPTRC
jgi:hypothetical protein